MKLYRLDQSEKQLLWVVTTLLVQVRPVPAQAAQFKRHNAKGVLSLFPSTPHLLYDCQGKAGGSDAAKLLTLAEAMLKKCIDAGGLSTQESLFVRLLSTSTSAPALLLCLPECRLRFLRASCLSLRLTYFFTLADLPSNPA